MTKQELLCLLAMRRQLADTLKLLASLKSNAAPKGGTRDPAGDLAAEMADLKDYIEDLKEKISGSEAAAAAWIQTIEDFRARMIFRLRFIHGKPWKEVAALIGGRSTVNSVKAVCHRYLSTHPERGGKS